MNFKQGEKVLWWNGEAYISATIDKVFEYSCFIETEPGKIIRVLICDLYHSDSADELTSLKSRIDDKRYYFANMVEEVGMMIEKLKDAQK